MNKELREKVLDIIIDFDRSDNMSPASVADAIIALFAFSLVKAQREAFVAGAAFGWDQDDNGDMYDAEAEASRRYPDA